MATIRGPRIVNSGLVLALDTADRKSYSGSGSAWNDLSGNGNNFTFVDFYGAKTPTFSSSNGGYVDVSDPNWFFTVFGQGTLSTSLKPTSITVEVWVNTGSQVTNTNESIITVQKGTGEGLSYGIKMLDKFGVYIAASSNTGSDAFANPGDPTMTTNTWYQALATYDGTTTRMYVNGIQRATSTAASGNITYDASNTKILFGAQYKGPGYDTGIQSGPWGTARTGRYISIARIYNRALTAAEALQNFQANRGRYGI